MEEYSQKNVKPVDISEDEKELVENIYERFRASYESKSDVIAIWEQCEKYWKGDVGVAESAEDPNSSTNVILPIIESQVADLIDGTMDFTIKGGPEEEELIEDHKQRLKWVWDKNRMTTKLDEGERDRLKLGTAVWRTYFDFDALNGRGMPVIEPISPEYIFPDPKIKDCTKIYEGDYFIYAHPVTRKRLRNMFGEKAKMVLPESASGSYDPRIWGIPDNSNEIVNDQAILYEYWEMTEDKEYNLSLRRVYMAGGIILEDSFEESEDPFYKINKYPFVMIPCYKVRGTVWGLSDVEILMDVQDTINDLDDQIKMNAGLTGNAQWLVGQQAGIDTKTWTNEPGLRVRAKNVEQVKPLHPPTMPMYITNRRDKAFQESEVISGRTDITEGRKPGSIRAASAIMALQEAGSRRAKHKKLMSEAGFSLVMDNVDYLMREFMDEEQSFDEGNKRLWSKPSDLNNIPIKVPNENFSPVDEESKFYKDLVTPKLQDGEMVGSLNSAGEYLPEMETQTKEAEFDITFQFGAGLPNTPSFLYQAALELMQAGIITQPEARKVIKEMVNWPIKDPYNPEGNFAGSQMSAEQLAMMNGEVPPNASPEQMASQGQPQGQAQGGDINALLDQLEQLITQLPPDVLQEFVTQLQGGGQVR